ncbi:baseplate J/gp47 family protein [Desulfovibrio sp. OttesenSCG-928-C06]|nr:baseplate J/gp47 family protein [Desulfovibrio sp. OttesenSCG-928-C06]
MAWAKPGLKQLYERIARDFSGRLQNGEALVSQSVEAVLSKVWALATMLLHGFLEWVFEQSFPDKAEEESLLRWASIWGMQPSEADFADGTAVFTAQAGTEIAAGALARGQNGLEYIVVTGAVESGGQIAVTLDAMEAGVAYNLPAGAVITLVQPVPGVQSEGTAPEGIGGGADAEKLEDFRARFLSRLRQPPRGGAKHDYEAWALEVSGVTRAWAFPLGKGLGSVTLTFVTDDSPTGPIPTPDMVRRVQEHIVEVMPADMREFEAFAPEVFTLQVVLQVKPDTPAMRSAVATELHDYLDSIAVAAGQTVLISQLRTVVGSTPGIQDYRFVTPLANVVVEPGFFPSLYVDFENWSE